MKKHIQKSSPPLRLSALYYETNSPNSNSLEYLMRVIDSRGNFVEYNGNQAKWNSHKPLIVDTHQFPEGLTTNLTSATCVVDSVLYAVSESRLLEFARLGEWWSEHSEESEDPSWKFLSVISTRAMTQ